MRNKTQGLMMMISFLFLIAVTCMASPPFLQRETDFDRNILKNLIVKPKLQGFLGDTACVLVSFFDDFSSYPSGSSGFPNWEADSSQADQRWRTEGEEFSQDIRQWADSGLMNKKFSDFILEFKAKIIECGDEPSSSWIGMQIRKNYHYGKWDTSDGGYFLYYTFPQELYLYERRKGWLQARFVGKNPTEFHTFRIVVYGYNIKAYVDGEEYINYTDPEKYHIEGYISLDMNSIHGHFDDIKVYSERNFTLEPGEMISIPYDYNHPYPSRITWNATNEGAYLSFEVRSANDTYTLANTSWSTPYTKTGSLIGTPKRYIQYRANFKTNNSLFSPMLYEVKIEPAPLKKIVLAPASPVRAGNLTIDFYFNEPMKTSINPAVSFTTIQGTNYVLGGSWQTTTQFRSTKAITTSTGDGFATLKISGAVTSDGCTMTSYVDADILIIDAGNAIQTEKIEFFPNPFSPNGDGFAQSTKLVNLPVLTSISKVKVKIYDLKGNFIKTLLDQQCEGTISVPAWDGTDENNVNVPIGLYIYEVVIASDIERTITRGTVVLAR